MEVNIPYIECLGYEMQVSTTKTSSGGAAELNRGRDDKEDRKQKYP